ncbi:class I SAM-dependent methyltransferase [Marispirochaeta aestuarii]|uniref:class I SAM-dependent methyltransferase n=1 Tax=Marispirochaeta aestuarii TaxID=1963862 RepID=UPI0029C85969|nr:class I SAM-dependent methyltransferase [Marispirochaeta aestuarii]
MKRKSSTVAYWNKVAPKYDRIVRRDLPIYTAMFDMIGPCIDKKSRVLDVPSGTGILALKFAGIVKEVQGCDISPVMVELANRKAREEGVDNCRFDCMDIHDLPFERNSFDAIVAANVLHLLDNPGDAVAHLSGFLKPGGVMLLPSYCHGETLASRGVSRIASLAGFQVKHRWSLQGYIDFIAALGFYPKKVRTLKGLFPLSLVMVVPAPRR